MLPIVEMIDKVISNIEGEKIIAAVRNDVNDFVSEFPMFGY